MLLWRYEEDIKHTNKQTNKQTKLCLQVELFFSSATNINLNKKPKLIGNQFLLNGKTLSKPQRESSAGKYLFAVY